MSQQQQVQQNKQSSRTSQVRKMHAEEELTFQTDDTLRRARKATHRAKTLILEAEMFLNDH
jgi:hypothetical protein